MYDSHPDHDRKPLGLSVRPFWYKDVQVEAVLADAVRPGPGCTIVIWGLETRWGLFGGVDGTVPRRVDRWRESKIPNSCV